MLLKEIVRQNRAAFFPGSSDWKDAIRKSCQPLVDTGCATPAYAQRIIECVEEFGPYIVIVPGWQFLILRKGRPVCLRLQFLLCDLSSLLYLIRRTAKRTPAYFLHWQRLMRTRT